MPRANERMLTGAKRVSVVVCMLVVCRTRACSCNIIIQCKRAWHSNKSECAHGAQADTLCVINTHYLRNGQCMCVILKMCFCVCAREWDILCRRIYTLWCRARINVLRCDGCTDHTHGLDRDQYKSILPGSVHWSLASRF